MRIIDSLLDLFRRLYYLLNRRRMERDLEEEMEIHRDMMGEPKQFGNALRLREESRDAWGWHWLDTLWQDISYAARSLRKSPAFALSAIGILSIGIGLNLTMFQTLNTYVLKAPPVKDPLTLVRFYEMFKFGTSSGVVYPVTQYVRHNNNVLSAVITQQQIDSTWGDDAAERVRTTYVSSNVFDELGYGPALGRMFIEGVDDRVDAPRVVVLSNEFWVRRFNSDPNIAGKTVRVNNHLAEVIGVARADYPGLDNDKASLWIPIEQIDHFNEGIDLKNAWKQNSVEMFGRLKRGVSPDDARDSLRQVMAELSKQRPVEVEEGTWLQPYSAVNQFRRPKDDKEVWGVTVLAGSLVLTVLLVACSNLSNLVLSRAVARIREFGVRAALGATRWRVMRQMLTETLVLSLLGAMSGLLLGSWGAKLLATAAGQPAYLDFSPDWRSMLAATAIAFVAMAVVGVVPAWKVSRQDLTMATKDGGQQSSGGLQRTRFRQALVATQVAGSCLLLVVAGLLLQGLLKTIYANPGFEYEQVVVLDPELTRYGIKGEEARSFWMQVKHAVASHGETESVALVDNSPLGSSMSQSSYRDAPGLSVTVTSVEPEFFKVMRVPILLGRTFEPGDDHATTVMISRRFALAMYGTTDVLGKSFPKTRGKDERSQTIVGVTEDARLIRIQNFSSGTLYRPFNPARMESLRLIARSRTDPQHLAAPMRQAARSFDSKILAQARMMKDDFERRLEIPRLISMIGLVIASLALLLACLGVFGVVSYGATLRTKEIGIRVTLGADRASVSAMLLRQLTMPTMIGVVIGAVAATPAAKFLAQEPFYAEADGYTVQALAVAVLLLAGALSALWPIVRALRTDPLSALRYE